MTSKHAIFILFVYCSGCSCSHFSDNLNEFSDLVRNFSKFVTAEVLVIVHQNGLDSYAIFRRFKSVQTTLLIMEMSNVGHLFPKMRWDENSRHLFFIVSHEDEDIRRVIRIGEEMKMVKLKTFWLVLTSSGKFVNGLNLPRLSNIYIARKVRFRGKLRWSILKVFMDDQTQVKSSKVLCSPRQDLSCCLRPPQTTCHHDLNGLHLVISIFQVRPCIWKDKRGEFIGIAADIIKHLSSTLHFSYEIRIPSDGYIGSNHLNLSTWNGIIGDVLIGRADMGVSCLSRTAKRMEVVDFTSSFMEAHLSAVYTPEDEKYAVATLNFLKPFHWKSWVLLLFLQIAGSVAMYFTNFCNRRTFTAPPNVSGLREPQEEGLTSLCYMSTICQQSLFVLPEAISGRIVFLMLSLSSTFLYMMYTSLLMSNIAVKDENDAVTYLQDLIFKKEYVPLFLSSASSYSSVKELFSESGDGRHFVATSQNFVYSFKEGFDKVKNEHTALIIDFPSSWFITKDFSTPTSKPMTSLVIQSVRDPYHFALQKNSPLTSIFSCNIMKLKEVGLTDFLLKKYFLNEYEESLQKSSKQNFTLVVSKLYPVFLILVVSWAISLLILRMEAMIAARWRN